MHLRQPNYFYGEVSLTLVRLFLRQFITIRVAKKQSIYGKLHFIIFSWVEVISSALLLKKPVKPASALLLRTPKLL